MERKKTLKNFNTWAQTETSYHVLVQLAEELKANRDSSGSSFGTLEKNKNKIQSL